MVDEPFQEKQFGGASVQLVIEVGEDAFLLHFPGEWWVGEDDVEHRAGIGAAEAGGERIVELDVGFFQLVQVEIEDGDFHHVGVVVVAGECLLFEEFPLRGFERDRRRRGRFARSAGLVCLRRMWVYAEMRKPAVPHAGSQMRWPGCGFTRATIRSMMWRGVRNWPLVPDWRVC